MNIAAYDPFARGTKGVGVRATRAHDTARNRLFPIEIWYPARDGASGAGDHGEERRDATPILGPHPLIVYSHSSGGNRRSSSFLCRHLASHGYVVAALDHSELVAPELRRRDGETPSELAARVEAVIGSRVPDVRFLLDNLLVGGAGDIDLDAGRIGLIGHSFGGWTVLATTEADRRVRSVVAMAAGGSSNPLPGILPVRLTFERGRDVPTLYLAAENDVPIPLDRVIELFQRTPGPKRLFMLRRADHQHFVDDVEGDHEAIRAMSFPGDAAWIPAAMLPISELISGEQAHVFVRGLALAHLDATLRGLEDAERFLDSDVVGELARRGVEAGSYLYCV